MSAAMNAPTGDLPPVMQLEVSGAGPTLVIVGGGLTGVLSWGPHRERLLPTHQVALAQPLHVQFAVDDRPLPKGYGVRMESAALLRACDERGWTRPMDLVGWSSGGLVAL